MDIASIASGQDFAQVIESALNACDVVLVLIGSTWATSTGQDGRRRLDDPNSGGPRLDRRGSDTGPSQLAR